MSIRAVCDSCRAKYRLADSDAGRSFGCPRCGARVQVPEAAQLATPETPDTRLPPDDSDRQESLMKPTKAINFEDLIDMTAMVDIVFFLLIFFLVTSLQTVDSVIDLPRPDGKKGLARTEVDAPDEQPQDTAVNVRIDRVDRISVDDVEVRGPDEVFLRLRELRGRPNPPTVLSVIGHGDSTHGTLVSVLDAGQELGFEKIRFGVVEDNEGGGP